MFLSERLSLSGTRDAPRSLCSCGSGPGPGLGRRSKAPHFSRLQDAGDRGLGAGCACRYGAITAPRLPADRARTRACACRPRVRTDLGTFLCAAARVCTSWTRAHLTFLLCAVTSPARLAPAPPARPSAPLTGRALVPATPFCSQKGPARSRPSSFSWLTQAPRRPCSLLEQSNRGAPAFGWRLAPFQVTRASFFLLSPLSTGF